MADNLNELVGRSHQLEALRAAFAATHSATSQLVVIEGQAGVGKSTLVRAFLAELDPRTRILRASGADAERHLDFGVVEQLYAEAAALGLRRDLPFGRAGSRPDALEVGAALLELARAAGDDPVVVVVDDAQWSDPPSLQAIAFVLRRLRDRPILGVVVHRPDAPVLAPIHRLCHDARGEWIHVPTMSAPELGDLVRLRAGVTLSRFALERLHAHTLGSPLQAAALADELDVAELEAGFGPLPAPRSYATLVLNRLADSAPEVERLVAAVAVVGRATTVAALQRMLGEG
ncbi:MAG: ATP-binding protein [Acidimicrobiia bacterium]|nr:ATP-binding protein [Acidimicrobiia bacterium]